MKSRQQLIESGKIWIVYPDGEADNVLYEGTKSNCIAWLKVNNWWHRYKKGSIRLAQVIYEPLNYTNETEENKS